MHQRRCIANGLTPISVRIVNNLEEPITQDDFYWSEALLALPWALLLSAPYLFPLRLSLLDGEVEVVAQRSHAANVAGH